MVVALVGTGFVFGLFAALVGWLMREMANSPLGSPPGRARRVPQIDPWTGPHG